MKVCRLVGLLMMTLAPCIGMLAQHEHQGAQHQHQAQVRQRGAEAMGFDQEKTTHHFRLTRQGGIVEVQANSADDSASRERIRQHLQEISRKFKQGDFSAPQHTHGRVPPGVQQMRALRAKIDYRYEDLQGGGRVIISSKDPAAVKAVHDFLRFQIEDHQTGDSLAVQ